MPEKQKLFTQVLHEKPAWPGSKSFRFDVDHVALDEFMDHAEGVAAELSPPGIEVSRTEPMSQFELMAFMHNSAQNMGEIVGMSRVPFWNKPDETYMRLFINKRVFMSNTAAEVRDAYGFLNELYKTQTRSVVITGAGLGVITHIVRQAQFVDRVWVIENNKEVATLSARAFEDDPKVVVVEGDAFDPPAMAMFAENCAIWHDIWPDISPENLPEMRKLRKLWSLIAGFQKCWAEDVCEYMESAETIMKNRSMMRSIYGQENQ